MRTVLSSLAIGFAIIPLSLMVLIWLCIVGVLLAPAIVIAAIFAAVEAWRD